LVPDAAGEAERSGGSRSEEARCSDIRDTCVVGEALRHGRDVATDMAEALERALFRGVRPSVTPLTRAEAAAQVLALHCDAHRPLAVALLASISPPSGLPRDPKTNG
jgi:hypothetical protein